MTHNIAQPGRFLCRPCRRSNHQQHPPRPRLLYGSIFMWISIVGGRFMAPFLEHEAHFQNNDALIGLVFAVGTGVTTVLAPSCGSIADKYELQKPHRGRTQILMIGVALGSVAFLLHGTQHVFPQISFWKSTGWHFALRIVYAIASAITFPVLDGITLAHLARTSSQESEQTEEQNDDDEGEDTSSFGKERLHGAIWWAITNLILGPCLDRWGFQVLYGFAIVSSIICLWSIAHYTSGQQYRDTHHVIPNHQVDPNDNDQYKSDNADNNDDMFHDNQDGQVAQTRTERSVSFDEPIVDTASTILATAKTDMFPMTTLLRMMCGTLYGCTFLLYYCSLKIGTSVVDNLAFLYFEYLQSKYWMCSVTIVLTVMFEIPIFHLAPMLLKKWGPGKLQIIAGIAYVVRVVGYTLVPKGRMVFVFFLEPMHGVTYACAKTSSVEFISTLMPTGHEASGQALLGLFGGLGCVTGLILGGWMDDQFNPRIMYRVLAFIVLLGMSIFSIASVTRQSSSPLSNTPFVSSSSTITRHYQIGAIPHCDSKDGNNLPEEEPKNMIELT